MVREMNQVKTLFISAGHSDNDPGAVANGHTEAEIVTEFRDLVVISLLERGILVTSDGAFGENLQLRDAIILARQHYVSVEFHCNSFSSASATGVETLGGNMTLGENLCDAISKTLGIANRGAKHEDSGQHSRLGFVSRGGGIIVELFFLSNPKDLERYKDKKHDLAKAVADVLINEVEEDK